MQIHRTEELEEALENIPKQALQIRACLSPENRPGSGRSKQGWGVAKAPEHISNVVHFLRGDVDIMVKSVKERC